MKNAPLFFLTLFLITVIAQPVIAAQDKIDPENYVCAELVAASVDGQPPLFEGLQLDGYAAAKSGNTIADAYTMEGMLLGVSDSCAAKPAEKALAHWLELRKSYFWPDEGQWRADKSTCGDYMADPDNGSGFVIWLDAYNRGKTGKSASILKDQATFDQFMEACKANPEKSMLDVIAQNAK